MKIITLFCKIDDFFLAYEKWQTTHCLDDTPGNTRTSSATASERSDDAPDCVPSKWVSDVEALLRKTRCVYWCAEFPHLVSYSRFVQLKKEVLTLLTLYMQ